MQRDVLLFKAMIIGFLQYQLNGYLIDILTFQNEEIITLRIVENELKNTDLLQ